MVWEWPTWYRGRFRSSKTKHSTSEEEDEPSLDIYIIRLRFLMCTKLLWDTRKWAQCVIEAPGLISPSEIPPLSNMNPVLCDHGVFSVCFLNPTLHCLVRKFSEQR